MRVVGFGFVMVLAISSGCGSDPCEGVSGTCIGLEEGASATDVQAALIEVQPNSTIAFGEGTFHFQVDLSLDVDNVTIVGAGMDKTVLSFKGQTSGAQGLMVTGDHFAMRDIAIEDTKGDALKLEGTDGVRIERVRVEWTGGPKETNGAYGLYPVQCKNVLIDGCVVKGASDAGVYVGQSDYIEVRNNRAELNVAGIEIENSTNADVHDNTATKNTGGILVFNLPGLQVENGAVTRVFHNQIFDNNTVNFAPSGNIVGLVPTGIEVTDPSYDQYPTAISIHDNTLTGTSDMPTGQLGALLISAIGEIHPNPPFIVPDVAWDGVLDPARVPYAADDLICIQKNGDADFIDLAWPLADATKPSTDMAPHDCAHAPLPEVAAW